MLQFAYPLSLAAKKVDRKKLPRQLVLCGLKIKKARPLRSVAVKIERSRASKNSLWSPPQRAKQEF